MTTTEAATAQAAVPVDDDAYLQIQRFYARQSQLLDFGHFGAWAATFTEDGSFDAPNLDEPIRGRDAWRPAPAATTARSRPAWPSGTGSA
jgi:hypothetical protein